MEKAASASRHGMPAGFQFDKKRGWRVQINVNGKRRHIGYFGGNKAAAIAAYESATGTKFIEEPR